MSVIKICSWNANGVCQHKLEVINFLKQNNVDVMLLSETHLTNKHFFMIPDYTFYKTNHPDGKAHGGTGILVRKRLKHFFVGSYAQNFLQATSITLTCSKTNLTLSAVYCPPRFALNEPQFLDYFKSLGEKFLAAGDYNSKHTYWGSRLCNPKGRKLYNVIINNNLDVASPGQPTYWPSDHNKTPDLIDFAITKGINRELLSANVLNELSSDHSPVLFEVYEVPQAILPPRNLTSQNTNWLKFKKYISTHIHTNYTIENKEQVDDTVTVINSILTSAAECSTPKNIPTNKRQLFITNTQIEHLVMEKRRLRREWQQNRCPASKSRLKEAVSKLKAALVRENDLNHMKFIKSLSPNKINKQSLWKASRSLKTPTDASPPIKNPRGEWARSDEDKAKVFAQHLSNVFQPNPPNNSSPLPPQIVNCDLIDVEISPREVLHTIKEKLVIKKAPGYDNITPIMLKNLPFIAIVFITKLFNAILKFGYYPSEWKKSLIIMILKPGKDPTLASSYRPISLLPCLSKLFEKVLLAKLMPYLQANSIIPSHQFGFREKHSTIEQVNRITNEIRTAFENREYCSAMFLDVAQAFDKVWHVGMTYKIRRFLPQNVHAIFESYLENRFFRVKYNSFTTADYMINAGVPQGSVLGPLLYLLFTSDIPTSNDVITSTFADDTAILCRHKNVITSNGKLQNHIRTIEDWLSLWRIKVNEQKSRHVVFTLNKQISPTISLNGIVVPQADEVTYLGIHLDRRLTWRKHIEAKKTQMKLKATSLHWLIGSHSPLNLEYKVLLYNQIIKPIWTYGLQLYGNASSSNIEILQRAQSKILRTITGAPWYVRNDLIHKDLNIPKVKTEFEKSRQKYMRKLEYHVNPLASSLANLLSSSRLKRTDRPAAMSSTAN